MTTPSSTSSRRLPYGRHTIGDDDIAAVRKVLLSDWLTTGPLVAEFEEKFARFTGARYAVAVSSGTSALHAAVSACGIGPGDEVIVPAITFAASANAVVYQGGIPVFCDIVPDTLLIDTEDLIRKITPKTKAVIAVDYAGQPCDYDRLSAIAAEHGLTLVADACHSPGGAWRERPVGTLARLSAFSFHPVKHITTAEGGMVTTDDEGLAQRMRRFRNHGIDSDHRTREAHGTWFYQMEDLGYNYRLSDLQCALGIEQLTKLGGWLVRRREIAQRYDELLQGNTEVFPLARLSEAFHAFHLYVVRLRDASRRPQAFADLRTAGIGVNVHYIPVHLHPFYQRTFGTGPGQHPAAESAYERILSLPIFPTMTDDDVRYVASSVIEAAGN